MTHPTVSAPATLGGTVIRAEETPTSVPASVPIACCERCGRELIRCTFCGCYADQHPVHFRGGDSCDVPVDPEPEKEPYLVMVCKPSCGYPAEVETICEECSRA